MSQPKENLTTYVHNKCVCCKNKLSDPISMRIGKGHTCRVRTKNEGIGNITINMFDERSDFTWRIENFVILIEDNGNSLKSIESDMPLILQDIWDELKSEPFSRYKFMYKDGYGVWDGIKILNPIYATRYEFFSINETDETTAIRKLYALINK